MQKINNITESKISKEKTVTGKGKIHIRDKKKGKEARTTIQMGLKGVKNPRIERYGETKEIAIKKIKEAELDILVEVRNLLKITQGNYLVPVYKNELEEFNRNIEKIVKQKKYFSVKCDNSDFEKVSDENELTCKYPISMFVYKMIQKKKKESEIITTKKKKKLSPDTVAYYWRTAQKQVIPYFGKMDVTTITEEQLQEYFDELDYSTKYLKDIRLVLKLSLDVAIQEKVIQYNPVQKVKIDSAKKSLGIEIEHLEQDRQEVWLELFEKDKRQWAYLFETILLTGARPEEGCRFKMDCNGFSK